MVRHRVRIRFRKEGDLRLIGHRDLVRTMERAIRRAGVQLSMTEGYHPKARLSFPLALAVGIEGLDEVMEVDFCEPEQPARLAESLREELPPGLVLERLQWLPPGTPKAQVRQVTYEVPLPAERQPAARQAVRCLLTQAQCWIRRPGRPQPIDLRAQLVDLQVTQGRVRMQLATAPTATAGPREVLAQIGLGQLESEGFRLTRTRVELVAHKL